MSTPKPFWMVHGVDCGPPRVRHQNQETAEREAVRLARLSPGVEFIVLQAVFSVVKDDLRMVRFEAPEQNIPF